ncbi:MFS transporter [Streptomyces sp. SCSIO ZS0520]|uniref:MFS transporter n=1 Tax=Streptomyces sp. SCSIO ZS0520 TaxID=2892996 RepID=UPI0021D943A4|nr:MFS transporter [Streptomyces sp. SCSIO ZS0520]
MTETGTGRRPRPAAAPAEPPEQRRILLVLAVAQLLSGAGVAAGITVGALLADEMLGSARLAGVPAALFTGGAALGALGIGRLSQHRGRRPGLTAGYAVAALGSLAVVLATAVDSVALLFGALLVYGAGTATTLQARYAGADLASPARRGRAVSTVLFATTLGAVTGPNLLQATGNAAVHWGLARLSGPFLLATVAYTAAALTLALALRPDPLLRARQLAARDAELGADADADADADAAPEAEKPGPPPEVRERTERKAEKPGRPPEARERAQQQADLGTLGGRRVALGGSWGARGGRRLAAGACVMVLTQLVMIAVMTMTPVHMSHHGHGGGATGLVIALHVGAMYLPSPLTGRLIDRLGPARVAAACGPVFLAAGGVAAFAPAHRTAGLALALVLLGLGWNLGLVSGTALVTEAAPLDRRAAVQGTMDTAIAVSGAAGGLLSGLLVSATGFGTLALGGALLALACLPIARVLARPPGA